MKVVVIGGAGVFGARLAELLVRDGHQVWVAGRRLPPLASLAGTLDVTPLQLDRAGDLGALWSLQPDVIVDAAGPFHAYGRDPYALARAAIEHCVNYLDLADDAAFCAGISALDASAKAAGVFALSGVSSVPALSSAVVASLAAGRPIDAIHTAILPGNRAPRGRAVVESILHQAGRMRTQDIDGQPTPIRSWSDPAHFDLGQGITRQGYVIGVPDQTLFPAFFQARTVTFHAGLELAVMNRGLAVMSWLRHHLTLPIPVGLIYHASKLLAPFGTDQGGMAVRVVLRDGTRCDWRLLVRDGKGPYVPGVAARTLLRAPGDVAHGARPALAEAPLSAFEAALSDLSAVTETSTSQPVALFPTVLGRDFSDLPGPVQDSHQTHAPLRLVGVSEIARGPGLWPRLIAAIVGFPRAGTDIPVTVVKTPRDGAEVWERTFGTQTFRSVMRSGPRGMSETFGPLRFDLELHVAADALHFPVSGGRFLGIPIPKWACPTSVATETARDGQFTFDVALLAPLTKQLIVRYRGTLRRDDG